MKKWFLVCCCVCLFIRIGVASPPETRLTSEQVSSLALYCKVWGFLKYYHTAVASGTVGAWDKVFVEHYDKVRTGTRADCISELLALCNFADSKRDKWSETPSVEPFDSTAVVMRPDFTWLSDTSVLTKSLSKELQDIRNRFYPVVSKYAGGASDVSSPNTDIDNKYCDYDPFPAEPIRVLALARYWNIIEYYYAYKKYIDRPWDSALHDAVYRVINTNAALEYDLAIQQLRHELNDAHASVWSELIDEYLGKGYLPFTLMTINTQSIITGWYGNKTELWLSKMNSIGLHKGDVLLAINGKPISELKETYSHYLGGSNESSLDRNLNFRLLRGHLGDKAILTVTNGDKPFDVTVHYQDDLLPSRSRSGTVADVSAVLNGTIGYIDLGRLQRKDVAQSMNAMMNLKAIIFDLRDNSRGAVRAIMDYLIPKTPFAYEIKTVVSRPGYFVHGKKKSETVGGENPHPYSGQVIILVNENTQGHGEFSAMALQATPGAITIGAQTAGAICSVAEIQLPGKITAYYPYAGYYYLDGRQVQRVGVKVDITVKPTVPGLNENRDEVLERAILFANTGK